MKTLPLSSSDNDLRNAIREWFILLAEGDDQNATAFLNWDNPDSCMTIETFRKQVALRHNGASITLASDINDEIDLDADEMPLDFPSDIVCRWIPGPETTERYPGCIADIIHAVPVDGQWSDLDALFYVRACGNGLSLQLRGFVEYQE